LGSKQSALNQGGGMSDLTELLRNGGGSLYKHLVESHVRKSNPGIMIKAGHCYGKNLFGDDLTAATKFVDTIRERLIFDNEFWEKATVKDSCDIIIILSKGLLPDGKNLENLEDGYKPENHNLVFDMFQYISLSIAFLAYSDRDMRKYIGIKKGIFG
jgi:hypothetical protein